MKYKINKGFITQKMDGKTVIFDGEESVLYTFNETATFMFNKLKLGWEEKKIIDTLVERYKIKREMARKDIEDIIKDLKKKKLIRYKKN